METYPIEVFKTGTHTAMNGTTKTYSVADLEAMATLYNGQIAERKAPLVLGHPKIDDPAYGWIESLAVKGEKMFALVSQVAEKVKDAVKAGMFKQVSIALFEGGLLRHVGLLGAAPPAVAGLAPVQFATDVEYLEFSWATAEWHMPAAAGLFRGIRDFFIEKFSLETADAVLPSSQIDLLTGLAPSTFIPNAEVSNFSKQKQEDAEMDEKTIKELGDKFAQMELQFGTMRTELNTTKDALAVAQNEIVLVKSKGAIDLACAQFSGFVDGLIRDGKVLPAEKESLETEFADTYRANSVLQFAADEKNLITKFKDRLTARPVTVKIPGRQFATAAKVAGQVVTDTAGKGVLGAEFAGVASAVDPASVDLDAQIEAYAAENKLSYEVAARHFGAV